MNEALIVDIETRNHINLIKSDAWQYSRSITAGINCLSVNRGGEIELFDYYDCLTLPKTARGAKLYKEMLEKGWVAHNAPFENYHFLNVWKWEFPVEKIKCTQAKCAYFHLPQSLDKAAQALKLPLLKDMGKGDKAVKTLMLCDIRGKHLTPETNPQDFADLYSRCNSDTEVTRLLDKALPNLPPNELRVWQMDFEVNMHGVPIDWFLVENATVLIDAHRDELDAEVQALTDGKLQSARQTKEIAKYLSERIGPVDSIDKESVNELMAWEDLPGEAEDLLRLRRLSGLSSLAKFDRMKEAMDTVDNRIRDNFWYGGAHTLRWTGKGAQLHNMVNGYDADLCEALSMSDMRFIKAFYPDLMPALQNAVRGAIYSGEDKSFVGIDLKQIEKRCTDWLGGESEKLNAHANGEDIYCKTASRLFNRPVTKSNKPERLVGKVSELSLGFGGGIGAIERNAKKNGLPISLLVDIIQPTQAERDTARGALDWYYDHGGTLEEHEALAMDALKQRWRAENHRTVTVWDNMFNGFKAGCYDDGIISIRKTETGRGRIVRLPSGGERFYREVWINNEGVSYESRFNRKYLIKGKFFENVVQSLDREIIVWYMLQVIVLFTLIHHCHDEYLLWVLNEQLAEAMRAVSKIHKTKPSWTEGLPIDFDMWSDVRYSK